MFIHRTIRPFLNAFSYAVMNDEWSKFGAPFVRNGMPNDQATRSRSSMEPTTFRMIQGSICQSFVDWLQQDFGLPAIRPGGSKII
jgi:hypothetical protein